MRCNGTCARWFLTSHITCEFFGCECLVSGILAVQISLAYISDHSSDTWHNHGRRLYSSDLSLRNPCNSPCCHANFMNFLVNFYPELFVSEDIIRIWAFEWMPFIILSCNCHDYIHLSGFILTRAQHLIN